MLYSSFNAKFTLDDLILSHSIVLHEKKEKLKFLKNALKNLNLSHCSTPLPLSSFHHQTSTEPAETNDEEATSETELMKPVQAPSPDYGCSYDFFAKLGEHEERRRRFAEERRREYNEYLKEAKFSSRAKFLERQSEAMDSRIRSYAELLDEKRVNEKAYRLMNDHHISQEPAALEPDFFGYNAKRHQDSKYDILNWQSKIGPDAEPLVPKNRLLATPSSRIKAYEYKEDLMRQIEDKHHREEERKRREKEEEIVIEKRLQEQRLRILKEYEEEKRRQRIKADDLSRKQEIIKEMIEDGGRNRRGGNTRDGQRKVRKEEEETLGGEAELQVIMEERKPTPVTQRLPRSPSYLHIRTPKSPSAHKSRVSLESKFRSIHDDYTKKIVSSPASARMRKPTSDSVKGVVGGDFIGGHSNPPDEPARYNPPDAVQLKQTAQTVQSDLNSNKKEAKEYANNKNVETNGNSNNAQSPSTPVKPNSREDDRVLARLSEIRRKMQEDHQRMVQQLKEKI